MSANSSKPPTPSRLSSTRRSSLASRVSTSTSTSSRPTSRAPSPSHSTSTHTRSPLPPTLRHTASFSSLRGSPVPAPAKTQRLTATALPPHLTVGMNLGEGIQSSASSIVGMEVGGGEGLFVTRDEDAGMETETETEAETEGDEAKTTATGVIDTPVADEEARRNLRDQLKRTLTQNTRREESADNHTDPPHLSPRVQGKRPIPAEDLEAPATEPAPPRQYFVLTDAGKPVFASSSGTPEDEDQDALASTTGLMQALISVFLDDGDKLRCVVAGRTRITFLLRTPLYLVCVSRWGEPESVARSHLEYLHLQILSVVSGAQLRRIFERRTNFDLRRLLSGAETFLHTLLTRLQTDLAMSTSSLICLTLEPKLRRRLGDALIPTKMKDILYVILIARGRVVTLVRPKKHSVHPADLHILLNTIHAPAVFDAPASWLPICLPRFNSAGFLHAYVSFPRHGEMVVADSDPPSVLSASAAPAPGSVTGPASSSMPVLGSSDGDGPRSASPSASGRSTPTPAGSASDSRAITPSPPSKDSYIGSASVPTPASPPSDEEDNDVLANSAILAPPPKQSLDTAQLRGRMGLGIVCVSGGGGGEFEGIRAWCEGVTKTLEEAGTLDAIRAAVRGGQTEYSATSLGIPGLRHFVYKSRAHVQVTHPVWDAEYAEPETRRRLITLYQTLHDAIHGKSGQKETLKLQYIRTSRESVMGWITQPFEMYISVAPSLPKSAVVGAANAVVRWVKREEARLFLRDAPVF